MLSKPCNNFWQVIQAEVDIVVVVADSHVNQLRICIAEQMPDYQIFDVVVFWLHFLRLTQDKDWQYNNKSKAERVS